MPKTTRPPAYRLYKRTGQAVVTLNGRTHYLGPHGTKVSRDAYDRLIAEWLVNGRWLPAASRNGDLSVNELILAYWEYAEGYYRKDGMPTSEIACIRESVRPLKRLYGSQPTCDFGPLALKACRRAMVDSGSSRGVVNSRVGRIKRMFKWAAENELVEPSVYHGLQAVSGLRRGRSEARETEPIKPVPDEHVDAIRANVSRQVWAMIELQRITGMRSGEVVIMRGCDLETTGKLWLYRPASHKTEHHGHTRSVELGRRAQRVLRPFLKADLEACLFSPADVVEEQKAEKRRRRQTKVQPSQKDRSKRKPTRLPRDRYTPDSYRRAITRACDNAKVPSWHPHQLRHTFATRVRKEFGLEVTRVLLGHTSPAVTAVYAEADRTLAASVVAKIG